jgi:hypothetical protein
MGWPGFFAPPPPENYNPEDPYADPVALTEQRQAVMRQKAVQVEKAKVRAICFFHCTTYAHGVSSKTLDVTTVFAVRPLETPHPCDLILYFSSDLMCGVGRCCWVFDGQEIG